MGAEKHNAKLTSQALVVSIFLLYTTSILADMDDYIPLLLLFHKTKEFFCVSSMTRGFMASVLGLIVLGYHLLGIQQIRPRFKN